MAAAEAVAAAAAAVVVPDALLQPLDCAAPSGGSTELPGAALPSEAAAPGQALPRAHGRDLHMQTHDVRALALSIP